MPELPQRLRHSTAYLLTQATKAAARLAQPMFAGERLRFPHYVTMAWLAETPVASQRALSQAMGVDPSDLVTVLDQLVEAGLLERTVDPSDRRRRGLTITPGGEAWLAERDESAARYEQRLRDRLGERDAEVRAGLLAVIEDAGDASAETRSV